VRTVDQMLDEAVAPRRLSMLLLACLAGLAVAVAAVGIYGVISYSVVQRTREIGVRIALGAQPADVLSLVLRHGTRMVAAGLLLGFAISMAASRSLGAVLFAVAPHDPLTLLACAATLLAAALGGVIVPARRATGADPAVAMRCD